MLSFLEHLADWAEGVALLLLCTARPELYEQHPHFGAGARNAQRINLGPLDNEAIKRLFERIIDEARRLERIADAEHKAQRGGTPAERAQE